MVINYHYLMIHNYHYLMVDGHLNITILMVDGNHQ